jgi:AcrR family transcriptional regulator
MGRRAEQIDATRERIVQATVGLHGSVGPAATTISAIAERAVVTRLTVYRHFPDEAALFSACSAHWLAQQQLPDPAAWSLIGDPADRLRAGLADLYRFFRAGAGMMTHVYRDLDALPAAHQQGLRDRDTHFREVLTAPFAGAGRAGERIRAVTGHAISFWTWRSLCLDQGLPDADAVDAMTGMILAVAASTASADASAVAAPPGPADDR